MSAVAASAYALLKQARENAYTLPAEFEGFRAELALYLDGDWHQGSLVARSAEKLEFRLLEDLQDWPRRELASMLAHRSPRPFDQGEGQYPMRVVEETPLGLGIALEDPLRSVLWLRQGQIVMVERNLPDRSFRIHIHSHLPAGERYLPHQFTLTYRRGEAIEAVESYTDVYCLVEGLWLPQRRQVVRQDAEGLTVRELLLSGHILL